MDSSPSLLFIRAKLEFCWGYFSRVGVLNFKTLNKSAALRLYHFSAIPCQHPNYFIFSILSRYTMAAGTTQSTWSSKSGANWKAFFHSLATVDPGFKSLARVRVAHQQDPFNVVFNAETQNIVH